MMAICLYYLLVSFFVDIFEKMARRQYALGRWRHLDANERMNILACANRRIWTATGGALGRARSGARPTLAHDRRYIPTYLCLYR
jgi:hypothetical protein